MTKSIPYLDCNASTPLDPEVWRVMQDAFGLTANASSVHLAGREASVLVEKAAQQVAENVGFRAEEVVFTSGATEANASVLLGFLTGKPAGHVLLSPLEHASIRQWTQELQHMGHEVETLLCGPSGRVCLEDFAQKLRPNTLAVSVMAASNLTSIRQPLDELATLLKSHGAFFHSDAAQEAGKRKTPFPTRLDALSLSAHKMYGPQGIGALCVRAARADEITPLFVAGGQQQGRRGGTLPVALIAGLGEAMAQASLHLVDRQRACRLFGADVRHTLERCGAQVLGGSFDDEHRLPHGVAALFPNVDGEMAISALSEVAHISMGSACDAAGAFEENPALNSMGLSLREQAGVLRLSWCHTTEKVDWQRFVEVIDRISRLS